MLDILREVFTFMRLRRKLWLAPLLMIIGFVGAILTLAQGSIFAPFIYTLF